MQAAWGNQQCTSSYISHGFAYAVRVCLILDYFAKDTYLRLEQDPGIYPRNGHVPAETDDTPRWHSGSMLHVREVNLQLMDIHALGSGNSTFGENPPQILEFSAPSVTNPIHTASCLKQAKSAYPDATVGVRTYSWDLKPSI